MKHLVLTRNKGPGNQRIVYGYALVSKLCRKRQKRELKYLWPDAKSQVTIKYNQNH
ncbi:hypothetical protein [Candidatus Protochlamydia sp. W-9]|uniref:hypothetical protein n=1 Tax=Candidatus Protochlamydia sp. W-9 TaxID=1785087 RepID=UPI00403D76D1